MSTATYPRISWIGLVLITTIALAFSSWQLRNEMAALAPLAFGRSSTSEYSPPADPLPFSFETVVQYFDMSLGHAPIVRSGNHAVFAGGRSGDGFFTISATALGSEILVIFSVTDDYGMNLVREFFEARLFQWSESEQLYILLYMGDGIRWVRLPRFDIVFEFASGSENTTVTMLFAPRIRNINEHGGANDASREQK